MASLLSRAYTNKITDYENSLQNTLELLKNSLYEVEILNKSLEEKVKEKTKQLQQINQNLDAEVKTQLEVIRKKDLLLIEQAKLAQIGEMLNMIAHQWRQPLNAISASAINLSLVNAMSKLTTTKIDETSTFIQNQTQNLSKIIDDFMTFNKTSQDSEFLLILAVKSVIDIIQAQFKSRDIKLEVNVDKNISVFHNQKSIDHSLINILVNAKDAFEENPDIENKTVKIYTKELENSVELIIEDNAGGITPDIMKKAFNPYFTTKEQGKGTGIGLYMTKQMIEKVEGTTIDVEMVNSHTLFIIKFTKKRINNT